MHQSSLDSFYAELEKINKTIPFKVSSRGWCYLLEEYGLMKGDFNSAEKLINDGRKNGGLPIDFTALDSSRAFSCIEFVDSTEPKDEADYIMDIAKKAHRNYNPVSFWNFQQYYLELAVEKVDLKSLFEPICQQFNIPIVNAKGWSDINLRNQMIQRFKAAEGNGLIPVLLYCGDHDPAGINISNTYRKNLNDLSLATGWHADNLVIDRFGLNYDFITENGISWVDNLETGSGKNLNDPKHKNHFDSWVQDYINQYGVRKVEANVLVTRIDEARELFKSTLDKYLDYEGISSYEADVDEAQQEVKGLVIELMKAA